MYFSVSGGKSTGAHRLLGTLRGSQVAVGAQRVHPGGDALPFFLAPFGDFLAAFVLGSDAGQILAILLRLTLQPLVFAQLSDDLQTLISIGALFNAALVGFRLTLKPGVVAFQHAPQAPLCQRVGVVQFLVESSQSLLLLDRQLQERPQVRL